MSRIELFGGFRVVGGDHGVSHCRTHSADAVCALLALHQGEWLSRERIIGLVWPEAEGSAGKQSLRTALTSIRHTLGEGAIQSQGNLLALSATVEVDVNAYRTNPSSSVIPGRVLDGWSEPWVQGYALEIDELATVAILSALEHLPPNEARTLGEMALRQDPSRLEIRAKLRELGLRDSTMTQMDTAFVGRKRELAELEDNLRCHRMVTITGPGGSGKTRLAAEVLRHHLPNGWFVSLANLHDPASVPEAIRQGLRLYASASQSALDQVVAQVSMETGLLVLDNFENVIAARAVVETLLAACPGLRILITSQVLLGLPQELEYPLQPMCTRAEGENELSESAELFVSRARGVCPSFRVTEQNRASVLELCERLDGYPLALEIAAAKSRLMTPAEMLDQMGDRLEFLTRGLPGTARHRSLRAALEWSYDRLSEGEQDLLADLSVFSGSFSLAAAADVSDRSIHQDLEGLVAHAWVSHSACDELIRFRLIESIRDFAREQLTPRRHRELIERHAYHYLDLARASYAMTFSPGEEIHFAKVDAEFHNVDLAWRYLIEHDPRSALTYASSLNWYWILRGLSPLAAQRMREALDQVPREYTPEYVHSVHSLGNFHLFQGDFEASLPYFEDALEIARHTDHGVSLGLGLIQWAQVVTELGRYDEGPPAVEEAIEVLRLDSNLNWLGAAYVIGALISNRSGDLDYGERMGIAGVQTCRAGGYQWGIASALNELAMVYELKGDFDRSIQLQLESIEIKEACRAIRSLALSYIDLASVRLQQGCYEECKRLLGQAFESLHRCSDLGLFPRAFLVLGNYWDQTGKPEEALDAYACFCDLVSPPRRQHAHYRPGVQLAGRNLEDAASRASSKALRGEVVRRLDS